MPCFFRFRWASLFFVTSEEEGSEAYEMEFSKPQSRKAEAVVSELLGDLVEVEASVDECVPRWGVLRNCCDLQFSSLPAYRLSDGRKKLNPSFSASDSTLPSMPTERFDLLCYAVE